MGIIGNIFIGVTFIGLCLTYGITRQHFGDYTGVLNMFNPWCCLIVRMALVFWKIVLDTHLSNHMVAFLCESGCVWAGSVGGTAKYAGIM